MQTESVEPEVKQADVAPDNYGDLREYLRLRMEARLFLEKRPYLQELLGEIKAMWPEGDLDRVATQRFEGASGIYL